MTISLIATASTDQASGNINFTHGLTLLAGDVLVAFVNVNGVGNTVTDNNGSTTFTVDDNAANPDSASAYVFHRVCGGSEPSAYAFTLGASNRSSISLRQYRGVDSSVWDVAPAAGSRSTGSGDTTAEAPAITILTSGACGLVLMADDFTPTTTTYSSIDNGYANVRSEEGQEYQVTADKTGLSTGTTGVTTITSSANVSWVAWQVALKPSAATFEQEGFRFGVDDGSESAHTWGAAQDTNISTASGLTRLIRQLLNTAGDKPATAFKLKYQKNGSGGYATVPIGATNSPTLSWGAAGTLAYSTSGGTSVAPTYPSGITVNSALILVVGQKPSSANGGTVTTPSGWTLLGSLTGANDGDTGGYTTTLGIDTGNTNIFVYAKDAVSGSESGTLSVTVGTNNVCWANIYRIQASDTCTWSYACGVGKDTSAGNVSIATGSMSIAAGDHILAGMVIPTDVTTPAQFSAEALSQTGTTFGAVSEVEEPDSATGNDIGGFLCQAGVSSGSGSGAVTLTATAGGTTTNVKGPGFVLRVRCTAVNNDIYVATSSNITAGGEATTARLTAPSGKSTADFVTGRRWDDENGTDTLDITTDDYTEVEWAIALKSGLANTTYFDLRVYAGDVALDTYTVTPRWTVSAALSATVNQVTETDTAQAIAKRKTKAVGQVTETDTAQAITERKVRAVAQVTETDTAQAITRRKVRAVGQVTETDTAQAITRSFGTTTVAVGQVTETDTAQAITRRKIRAVAQVTETDTAQAITKRKVKAVAQVTETDTAQAIAKRKVKAVAQVTETDTAQAITERKVKAVAQVTETDTAQAIAKRKVRAVGQVTETDTAQPISSVAGVLVGQVVETDTAQAITRRKVRAVGQVTETDTAQALRAVKVVLVQQVSESDLAQSLFPFKYVSVVQVIETDLAQAIGIAKWVSVGQAVETDTAQSISTKPVVYVLLSQAVETELAFAMRYEYSRKVGLKIPERRRSTLSDGEPLTGLSKRSPRRLYK